MAKETYLGDGVYAEFDGYQIWIYTSNGIERSPKIALEPSTFVSLVEYHKSCYKNGEADANTQREGPVPDKRE